MRFVLLKDLRKDPLMRPLMGGMLLFLALFLMFDLRNAQTMPGWSPDGIATMLYGDEEAFIDPLEAAVFWEMLHTQTFVTMMALLTLSALFGRLCRAERRAVILVNVVMISALSSLLALIAAFYLGSGWILPYLIAFGLWHLTAAMMILISGYHLART